MKYISLLCKFRAGDKRVKKLTDFLVMSPHSAANPPFSHFMFWRPSNGCGCVEIHVLEGEQAAVMAAMARSFGAFNVAQGGSKFRK